MKKTPAKTQSNIHYVPLKIQTSVKRNPKKAIFGLRESLPLL